jgi:hypothetical protein
VKKFIELLLMMRHLIFQWAADGLMPTSKTESSSFPSSLWHSSRYSTFLRKEKVTMPKTLDLITEIIRNPKHAFRKVDDRPVKAQKHRYERRKVKEFIRLGDWVQGNTA